MSVDCTEAAGDSTALIAASAAEEVDAKAASATPAPSFTPAGSNADEFLTSSAVTTWITSPGTTVVIVLVEGGVDGDTRRFGAVRCDTRGWVLVVGAI